MLYTQIKADLVAAQKSGDTKLVGVLKLLSSEITYAQVDFRGGELPDTEVVRVVMKEVKKRRDAIEIYEKANSPERVESEKYELSVIEKYMPEMMSEEEVRAEVVKQASETGFTGGRLMRAVMVRLKGKADGAVVQKIVMESFKG